MKHVEVIETKVGLAVYGCASRPLGYIQYLGSEGVHIFRTWDQWSKISHEELSDIADYMAKLDMDKLPLAPMTDEERTYVKTRGLKKIS